MMKRTYLFLVFISLLMMSCREKSKPERVAEQYLSAFLDCRCDEASRFSSPKVTEQIRWRASQMTQAEVELMNENEPQIEAEDIENYGDSCIVFLRATDVLLLDSIGLPGNIGEQRYRLVLQKEKGRNWKVTALNP